MIIAVDGPAASGKGTLARRLAEHLGYPHLDTGTLYRAVAAKLLRAGCDPNDAEAAAAMAAGLAEADRAVPELRDEAVGGAASIVAAQPRVRAALLGYQQNFAAHPPGGAAGAVLDGRDIGSVVVPGAAAKIYITATEKVRAERRHKELLGLGVESIRAEILAEMRERDGRDRSRSAAPLQPASDAFLLDTTDLDADAAFAAALLFVRERLEQDRIGSGQPGS